MNFISYSAVVLDDKSRAKLLKVFGELVPEGWETIAHHMTITMGGLPEHLKKFNGTTVRLTVDSVGYDDKVIALGVTGFESKNKQPHITLAVNRSNGGKPVMSNNLTNWTKIPRINITGRITEVEQK